MLRSRAFATTRWSTRGGALLTVYHGDWEGGDGKGDSPGKEAYLQAVDLRQAYYAVHTGK